MFFRSSLSSWSVGSQEAALQDVDHISFLFSTMTGFSSSKLASLQEAGDDYALSPSPLSPLSLYPTPLEQFTHHWDVVEVRSLLSGNYSTPHAHSYQCCCCQSETLENEFSWDGDQEVKKVHCFENWKVLIFWTQLWSFSPPLVPLCFSYRAQRVKALSWHSGWEGDLYRVAQVGDA